MKSTDETMALARRAVIHFRNKTTDQAPDTMTLPVDAYTDQNRYAREIDKIFRHLPLAVALTLEVPTPRSYRAMTLMDVPIVVVRGEDGIVRAFLNTCRHRGAQVCKEGSGSAQRFVCPYHAWQYDTQGRLIGRYGAATFGDVSADTHSLVELNCAERAGLLWVSLTPGASFDIDQWLGDFAGQLESLNLREWIIYDQRDIAGPGWKVAFDGYLEAYHHSTVHPNTVGQYTIGNLSLHDTFGPHQRIVFGRRSLSEIADLPEEDWKPAEHIRLIHSGFPNLSISGVIGDHCLVSQVFPGPTPDSTITRQTVLMAKIPETEAEKRSTESFSRITLQAVRDEDYVVGATIQNGLKHGGNRSFIFGRNEPAIQHYHRSLARLMNDDDCMNSRQDSIHGGSDTVTERGASMPCTNSGKVLD